MRGAIGTLVSDVASKRAAFPWRRFLSAPARWIRQDGRGRFLAVTVQLGLVLLVANLYEVEGDFGFLELTPLIFAGFVVHAVIPLRGRMPFFLALSLLGIGLVLGRGPGVVLIGLGLGLVGICHLPVRFSFRVALLVVAALGLAAVRGGWIQQEWSPLLTLVLPVLGAMFMFRLIIYMYELRHEKQPASIWERLSYFFMLPNVCFLLFPVVDYRTFRRTYYDAEANDVYQKGVHWIFRGVIHLLLYRVVYYEFLPTVSDVVNLAGVVQYMAATYLLYLRISGQFHLIIGITCLFGFNLPETHHLYYLASSFNDYWRRINIYWKDFMMKIFYYPSLNKLRKHGLNLAIVVSTLIVFAGTWLLHSYQWFWLQGTFPLTAPDALFWGILGVLVVVNSVYEANRGRRRSLGTKTFSWASALRHAFKVAGMLVVITILWTLWSSHSIGEFFSLMEVAAGGAVKEWLILGAVAGLLVGVGVLVQFALAKAALSLPAARSASSRRMTLTTILTAGVLIVMTVPELQPHFGPSSTATLASLRRVGLNAQDEQRRLLGYYEGLLDSRGFLAARWDVHGKARPPANWGDLSSSIVTRETDDVLRYELRPLAEDTLFGAAFKVNRWGMRDRDYEREKPASTFRIAMIGASYVVGGGVEQDETFEALIEARLNRELQEGPYDRVESLNFAVGGYDPVRTLVDVRRRVLAFEPDLVCYVVHANDGWRLGQNLATVVEDGKNVSDVEVQTVLVEAGVEKDMPREEIVRRLSPLTPGLLQRSYAGMSELFRRDGIEHVAFVLPRVIDAGDEGAGGRHRAARQLRDAGFETYDLWDVYGSVPTASLWLGPWDEHPNVLGHQLIADRIYHELTEGGHLLELADGPAP